MIDSAVKLIEALTKLLGALAWPVLTLFVLVRFGPALREFFGSLGELTLKGGGFEASAKRQQAHAAASLAAATVAHPEAAANPQAVARDAKDAYQMVADVATPRAIRRVAGARVLWVDDRPNNNIHERESLQALGVRFVLATSTEEALEKIRERSIDAIISDMGRQEDPQAGYTLLEKLRATGNQTPFIIYAGSRAPEHSAEARNRGAVGCTNRPGELFQMVLSVLDRAA